MLNLLRKLDVAIVLFLGISPLNAQSNAPGTYADDHNPAGPAGPAKVTQVWNVDPITGSLSINIPLLAVAAPGRGPTVPYSLRYNSGATVALSSNIVPPQGSYDPNSGHQSFGWYGPMANTGGSPAPWSENLRLLTWSSTAIPDVSTLEQGCTVFGPYVLSDENGSHDLNLMPITPPGGTVGECGSPSITTSSSSDGSSIQSQGLSGVYPNGTQFTCAFTGSNSVYVCALEDSNGNKLPSPTWPASGAVSDAMGRPLYSVQYSPQTGGLFANPLQITTYTTTGTAATYALTWETASFSFTMPEPNSSDIVSASSQYPAEVNPTAQGSLTVLESLALPDSTSYQFCYDPTYATVDKISFPTGGYVRFVYGIRNSGSYNLYTPNGISSVVVTDVYRSTGSDTSCPSTPSASEDHWHYSYQNLTSGSNSGQLQSSVTDPMGNTTTYAASPYSYTIFTGAEPTWQETYRQISNGTTPVRTIYTTYGSTGGSTALPATITTTYNDASPVVQQQTRYAYDQYNNVVEKDESDGYPCSSGVCSPPGWLRKTLTTYYWAINSGYQTAHIVDKPYTETVTDGSGNPYAETIFGYDAYALSGSSGYANHDDQNYPATKLGPRGNLTSEARCVAFLGGTCSSWITTIHHYDLAGQLVSTTDPAGNTTSYNYTDQYVDGSPSAPTDGYVTTVTYPQTNAISHSDQFTYHFYSGKEASHTDWNNQVTSFLYTDPSSGAADPLNRLRQITLPKTVDGSTGQTTLGWTRYTYSDVPGSWSVETQRLMSSSGTATSTTANYDGLGRLSNTITADSLGNDEIDRTYDGDGRLFTITNPYRNTSDLSYGVTTYTYDALGRMLSLKDPDSTSNSTYKQTWSYSGLTVLFTDESGNQWQRTSDALGRLTKVQEPNGTSPAASLTTNYGYDLLDDLISVNQAGDGSSPARNRSFTYDGLGRLRSATNPESGMTTYHYSSLSGPLCSGDTSSVCSKTDARGVTTNFSYDALNRVSSKSYNDGATPWVCYLFDTAANGNGRLAYDWTQKASTGGCSSTFPAGNGYLTARSISAYDAMGRLQSEQQYTPASVAKSTSYLMIYTYDLAGNLTSSTTGASPPVTTFSSTPSAPCQNAPSFSTTMLTFVNCYDGTGRLLGVTSNAPTGPTSLFAAQGYSAFGGLTTATYGGSGSGSNAVTLTRTYDKRLRIASETDLGNSPAASTNGSATVTITGAEQNQ